MPGRVLSTSRSDSRFCWSMVCLVTTVMVCGVSRRASVYLGEDGFCARSCCTRIASRSTAPGGADTSSGWAKAGADSVSNTAEASGEMLGVMESLKEDARLPPGDGLADAGWNAWMLRRLTRSAAPTVARARQAEALRKGAQARRTSGAGVGQGWVHGIAGRPVVKKALRMILNANHSSLQYLPVGGRRCDVWRRAAAPSLQRARFNDRRGSRCRRVRA